MLGQCLRAGWTEKQFWLSSYRGVYALLIAMQKEQARQERLSWEQTRAICAFVAGPYRKKGDNSPVFVLPWDNEGKEVDKGRVLTPEEIQEKFAKRDARILKKFQDAKRFTAENRTG